MNQNKLQNSIRVQRAEIAVLLRYTLDGGLSADPFVDLLSWELCRSLAGEGVATALARSGDGAQLSFGSEASSLSATTESLDVSLLSFRCDLYPLCSP